MKATKVTCLLLATAMLASSCSSSYQAAGGMSGAMIGSHVGGTIGLLSGHGRFRGENAALGSLIGMGIGAVLGVGISSQIEEKEKAAARQSKPYSEPASDEQGGYYGDQDYQIGGGAYQGCTAAMVNISELTYMDSDGDGYISKNETVEVEGFITNTSGTTLQDIVIFLTVDDRRHYRVSPSLTTTLQPGQKIRYTGRVHCDKARRGTALGIRLNTVHESRRSTSNALFIRAL